MTYYDLNMNSKKLTATTAVERDTAVAGTSVQQIYKASNSSPANCATELRMAGGSQTSTGTIDLFVNPDASQQLAGYYAYTATTPGLFLRSNIPDTPQSGTEYCVLTDNAIPGVNELPENKIYLRNTSTLANNTITLRSAFDLLGQETNLALGIDSFLLSVNNQSVLSIPTGSSSTSEMTCRRRIKFNTDSSVSQTGILANSTINATTTGSTTLTNADAFRTVINTPSAVGRIFVLPAPSATNIGYWWEVCNKSASQSITINSNAGVALATISATTAGGAGNVARIGIDSAGTSYFRTQ